MLKERKGRYFHVSSTAIFYACGLLDVSHSMVGWAGASYGGPSQPAQQRRGLWSLLIAVIGRESNGLLKSDEFSVGKRTVTAHSDPGDDGDHARSWRSLNSTSRFELDGLDGRSWAGVVDDRGCSLDCSRGPIFRQKHRPYQGRSTRGVGAGPLWYLGGVDRD